MALGMSEFVLLAVVALLFSGIPLWGAIDAARMKNESWEMAGRDKRSWVMILIACAVFWGVGLLGAGYYFMTVRRSVAAFERDPNRPTQTPL